MRDEAGHERAAIGGAFDERVHGVAVRADRRGDDAAMLVLRLRGVGDDRRATGARRLERRARVGHTQRDVGDAVAVAADEVGDRSIRSQRAREHHAHVALLEQVRGAVADSGLRPGVGRQRETERGHVEVCRLARVADVEVQMIPVHLGERARAPVRKRLHSELISCWAAFAPAHAARASGCSPGR